MVGFGLVYGGVNAVFWSSLARVSSSWVISPLMGAAVSFLVYKCIRRVSSRVPSLYKLNDTKKDSWISILIQK
jgi:sodium-dependent phosphate transporter